MMTHDEMMEFPDGLAGQSEAHEWECKTCGYILRLEIGPLCCEGGVCNKCHGPVEYHGIKRGIPKSTFGVTKPPNDKLSGQPPKT